MSAEIIADAPNAVYIPQDAKDAITLHSVPERWSFASIEQVLHGKPDLYDILRPLNSKGPLSVGVYCSHVGRGKNAFASKVLGHPILGDVLIMKTYDDGESPTKVLGITPNEIDLIVRCPKDTWLNAVCSESPPPPAPSCRVCGKPYFGLSRDMVCSCAAL
eukprot:jgi/Mesvir1/20136/Mv13375-RA.1